MHDNKQAPKEGFELEFPQYHRIFCVEFACLHISTCKLPQYLHPQSKDVHLGDSGIDYSKLTFDVSEYGCFFLNVSHMMR